MDEPITGGCACGAVRYECDAEPMCSWVCHCRECQRSTGGGGAVNAVFNIANVKFTRGEPKFHHDVGTSGEKTHRGFCADCGSPIAAKADLLPHVHGISVASLDDPGRIELVAHIWTVSAQPWDYMDPELLKIEGTPTEADFAEILKRVSQQ